jgi:LysR family transcriptional regulator, transcriptional activator of nhaA
VGLIGHPARLQKRRPIKTLLTAEPLIVPTAETAIRASLDALLEREGVRPRLAAEVDDMAMMRLLVRDDLGLAVIPPIVVQDELREGVLVNAGAIHGISEIFYAVTLSRRFPNPLVHELLRGA